jgi:sugar phosphate isomerase/epimerase
MQTYPFRLGTTSYIIPADILPNAHYLAGKIRDIELILFEVDDGPNNLPSPQVIDELSQIASQHDLTYTVHLPLDLKLGEDGSERDQSLVKAQRVIECTRGLNPWAYVLHLDGKLFVLDGYSPDQTLAGSIRARAGDRPEWAGSAEKLAVENLETYPLDFIQPVLERIPVSRCVDIGHLWLDGHDPSYLRSAMRHASSTCMALQNDHRSLTFMPEEVRRCGMNFSTQTQGI